MFLGANGQSNNYFGSIIIPKNEYIIRLAGTNFYWGVNKFNKNELILENGVKLSGKFMFIPAGDGFYFIKYQLNGNYVNVGNSKINHDNFLKITEPIRSNEQKFKVVCKDSKGFKFISVDNQAIECIDERTNGLKLKLMNDYSTKNQTFEILEAESKKTLN